MAYIFHHSDYAPSIDKHLKQTGSRYFMKRINHECIRVDIDKETDERSPFFFKFLSVKRINHVLRAIMGHHDPNMRFKQALSDEKLQMFTIPYDDKKHTIEGEELHVVYSIASLNSPFRKGIVGPQGVHLYEHDIPHFGIVYVYRSECTEYEDTYTELHIKHKWIPIETSANLILRALKNIKTS